MCDRDDSTAASPAATNTQERATLRNLIATANRIETAAREAQDEASAVLDRAEQQGATARGATCPSCGGSGRLLATADTCGACDGAGHVSLAVAHGQAAYDLRSIGAVLTAAMQDADGAGDMLQAADRLAVSVAALTSQALEGASPDPGDAAGPILRESVRSLDGDLPALAAALDASMDSDTPAAIASARLIAASLAERAAGVEDQVAKLHQA